MDPLFALPYGPFIIFAMRIVDVSLGTVRLIIMVRGWRKFASLIGFFEVLVWVVAAGSALQHLESPFHLIGYAAGFGAGTYVGIAVENVLALGTVVVRAIIPGTDGHSIAEALRDAGYAVTEVDGRGQSGPVDILNTVVSRRDAERVAEVIEQRAERSFVTVEEVRASHRGRLPPSRPNWPRLVRR